MILKRRNFIALASLCALAGPGSVMAQPQPVKASVGLIAGQRQGTTWQAGLVIGLEPGWKTYWRNPGDAGLPPEFDWSGSKNLRQILLDWPAPRRFSAGGTETIGYEDEVIFPLTVTPQDPAQPVDLALKLFFGACHDVCVPVSAEATLHLEKEDPAGAARIAAVRRTVPKPASGLVRTITLEGATMSVLLADEAPEISDIFVEGPLLAAFGRPEIAGRKIRIPVSNLKDIQSLAGQELRLTLLSEKQAYDVTVLAGSW